MTAETAVQDLYEAEFAHCYGCGRLNEGGLHVRTVWRDGQGEARYTPRPGQVAVPGYVYGGLIASLVDCHGIGTAAAAAMEEAGLEPGADASPRFVTASLRVDFLAPTPMGRELRLRARPVEVGARKVVVEVEMTAGGPVTARGRVVAVRMPESFGSPG
ncbi:MAG: PaaI family thioesterase [Gemmatimonadetes bacterium]|nr:PaaI family thioesterase [Gemmatimonadota bacterium]NIQ58948.1 PaaI family thioesterase [Gemmatimonadota bacterium]NIU79138.1 PaaI family thioesterase [Gammaproteobacteria bacterium]NIX47843.1 PaaI family thioesterase [Gemmatimonadota bacterium]NIY12208.1 PaaI family thioesterase [Gemmatimonadota bacterium]